MQCLVGRYLDQRRKLGYGLRAAGKELEQFGRFADQTAPGRPITTALALQWATLPKSSERTYHAMRLIAVRSFARFCFGIDPRTEVPPFGLLGPNFTRRAPHLYSRDHVRLIMGRARRLSAARSPLRPHMYETLVGLLFCTGMRLGEALRLRLDDLEPTAGTLRVPACKFSPERTLPLHPSAVRALEGYRRVRLRLHPLGELFFVDLRGRPLSTSYLKDTFRKITRGIAGNGARPRPRWPDFRHSFASRLVAKWACQAEPVAHHLLFLSRYLGHKSFRETWWYISPSPDALQAASSRFHAYQLNSPNL
jgi:integrase